MRSAMLLECLLALSCGAPPELTIPAEIAGEPITFVEVRAKTDAKWVRYVTLDPGLAVFPSNLLADKSVTVVVASKPGRYRVLAYAGNDEGGAEAITTLVIGNATVTPPPKDPPTEPDKPADPPTSGKYYFLVVRPNGPASAEFAKAFADPAWDELRKAGHTVKEMSVEDSLKFYRPADGQGLPFVVTLTTGQTPVKVLAGPVPMPKTGDAIRDLPKGVK